MRNHFLYTTAEIRQLEQLAINAGMSAATLMQSAGRASYDWLRERWPQARSVVIFCGTGNNGGDGFVLAQIAHEQGLSVDVRYLGDLLHLTGEAKNAMRQCQGAGVDMRSFSSDENIEADIFVDALLGIGLSGDVREPVLQAIKYINQHGQKILAIDVPSGIQSDTGMVKGSAVRANSTITFIGIKRGLVTGEAVDYVGELICHHLNLSADIMAEVQPTAQVLKWEQPLRTLRPRSRYAHKGYFGHVLVVGGDHGMTGALRLAALGVLRSGAGLVTLATRPEHAVLMNVLRPELISYVIKQAEDLTPLLERASVVVIGPGLGQSPWAQSLLTAVLSTDLPLIVDADALNLLAKNSQYRSNWILTPHPGEAARLLQTDVATIQSNRFKAANDIQEKFGGIAVVKGAGTIICCNPNEFHVCTLGNPGMASGGMGDLLSGIIAGLITQTLTLPQAAIAGVGLHAKAGDLASRDGERGMIATDLLPFVRKLINRS